MWRKGGRGEAFLGGERGMEQGTRGVWGRGVRREVVYPRIYARVRRGVRGARCEVRGAPGARGEEREARGTGIRHGGMVYPRIYVRVR